MRPKAIPNSDSPNTLAVPHFIQNKRNGAEHTPEEIKALIQGYTEGTIPDYQMSAWLMATYFSSMNFKETAALTQAMVESGQRYDWSIKGHRYLADKHSTGGLGDKVSLILAPLVAACGLTVPMMAGRGLGHTGGTIDKLESIPGFKVILSEAEIHEQLKTVGCVIISQSEKIAPADRKIYALRDVTATVECIPLITSSILSKKIAEGTKTLVMDIKVGAGAFLKTKKEALALAKMIKNVGKLSGLKVISSLTNMDQPLGYACGNAVEIFECLEVLRNETLNPFGLSSLDLKEITLHLASLMLEGSGKVKTRAEGRKLALQKLEDGSAYEKFLALIAAQGGKIETFENPKYYLNSEKIFEITSTKKGFVTEIETEALGKILVDMGAGRKKTSDQVDPTVGILVHKKIGQSVRQGDPLFTVFSSGKLNSALIGERLRDLVKIKTQKKTAPKLLIEVVPT